MPIRPIKKSGDLAAAVEEAASEAKSMYHRLVIVVEMGWAQKDSDIATIATQHSWPAINVNLELSSRLKDMPSKSRPLNVDRCLHEIIGNYTSDIVFLTHSEILFDRALEQNPGLTLRHLSRNKTIVAAWNGHITERHLIFGPPEHPDHQRFEVEDEIVLNVNAMNDGAEMPVEARP